MVQIRILSAKEICDPELREMMEASGDQIFGIFGHCPEAFKAFLPFLGHIKYRGNLPFALKELVRLKIAELNECHR